MLSVPAHSLFSFRDHASVLFFFFFFNDTATTEIYTLSLHDALPILSSIASLASAPGGAPASPGASPSPPASRPDNARSEEHTSELQSRLHLVCRLLLEKKKKVPRRGREQRSRHDPEPEAHRYRSPTH